MQIEVMRDLNKWEMPKYENPCINRISPPYLLFSCHCILKNRLVSITECNNCKECI